MRLKSLFPVLATTALVTLSLPAFEMCIRDRWYAIVIALMTVVIGTLFVPGGTHKKDIFSDANNA